MNLKRIDRTAVSIKPLHEQGDDREYWASKTPLERLEALEFMRQVMYGYDRLTDRVQRVYTVAEGGRRKVTGGIVTFVLIATFASLLIILMACNVVACNAPEGASESTTVHRDTTNNPFATDVRYMSPFLVNKRSRRVELSQAVVSDSIVARKTDHYEIHVLFPQLGTVGTTSTRNVFNNWVKRSIMDSTSWFLPEVRRYWYAARGDGTIDYGDIPPPNIYGRFTVNHADRHVISVFEELGWGFGAPMEEYVVFNFDPVSGKEILFHDLFRDSEMALKWVSAHCIESLTGAGIQKRFAKEIAGAEEHNFNDFGLTADTLFIYFSFTGSRATGSRNVAIPYSELCDLFDPNGVMKWFL